MATMREIPHRHVRFDGLTAQDRRRQSPPPSQYTGRSAPPRPPQRQNNMPHCALMASTTAWLRSPLPIMAPRPRSNRRGAKASIRRRSGAAGPPHTIQPVMAWGWPGVVEWPRLQRKAGPLPGQAVRRGACWAASGRYRWPRTANTRSRSAQLRQAGDQPVGKCYTQSAHFQPAPLPERPDASSSAAQTLRLPG